MRLSALREQLRASVNPNVPIETSPYENNVTRDPNRGHKRLDHSDSRRYYVQLWLPMFGPRRMLPCEPRSSLGHLPTQWRCLGNGSAHVSRLRAILTNSDSRSAQTSRSVVLDPIRVGMSVCRHLYWGTPSVSTKIPMASPQADWWSPIDRCVAKTQPPSVPPPEGP